MQQSASQGFYSGVRSNPDSTLNLYNITITGQKEVTGSYSYFYGLLSYGAITIRQGNAISMTNTVDTESSRYFAMRVGEGGSLDISHTGAAFAINGGWNTICQVESKGTWIRNSTNLPVVSGTATGKRYAVAAQGLIDTQGGGANYFPGSTAGTVDSANYAVYK
jgi:hypothetical protein